MVPNGTQRGEMERLPSVMRRKMEETPKLLSPSAGKSECCIFRVPQNLVKIKDEAFYPCAVSIGPYHHGEVHLQMLEEHKWRFLRSLLARCKPHIDLECLINAISPEEARISASYSECTNKFSSSELVMMMVLDGCFIIELLSINGKLVEAESDEPIFNVTWIGYAVLKDLYKLENQMPYFVLEILFDITRISRRSDNNMATTLAGLVLNFFNTSMQRPLHIINHYIDRINNPVLPKHLLDLLKRSFVIPRTKKNTDLNTTNYYIDCIKHVLDLLKRSFVIPRPEKNTDGGDKDRTSPFPPLIQSAQMLQKAGIKFQTKKSAKSFLEISFNKGILEIPRLILDACTHNLLLNFVAFEQCYAHYPQRITSYILFMGCLINSSADSEYLHSKKIIDKYIGTHEDVALVFNQIGNNVSLYLQDFYLATVFEGIDKYCSSSWHIGWNGIKHKYFSAPWAWIAALGALLGLLLTATQTVFTVLGYINPGG